jgi:RNA polymerase sigma factor (TIGR02999 family)
MNNATHLRSTIQQEDPTAADQLLPLVYDELQQLASIKLAHEKSGQMQQAAALVHDAYIRLVDVENTQYFSSRGHFFAAAAEAMRRILVESARRDQQVKRGGDLQRVALDDIDAELETRSDALEALDESLQRLEAHDPLAARVVKLRYFSGLTMPEAAESLEIPLRTAERTWTYARTWLHRDLR